MPLSCNLSLLRNALIGLCSLLLLACGSEPDTDASTTSQPADQAMEQAQTEMQEYDFDSWKTMIPADCKQYFDGCNSCTRAEGSEVAACTRKACIKYEKPVCLNPPAASE